MSVTPEIRAQIAAQVLVAMIDMQARMIAAAMGRSREAAERYMREIDQGPAVAVKLTDMLLAELHKDKP